ncbi:MAG: hypothetical protein M1828_006011 [Chrysothrix sp. TS-e1954]|nr:MAG: hypothetical protein M1828_006011 [Chrysothrix sp. TS-e1954]
MSSRFALRARPPNRDSAVSPTLSLMGSQLVHLSTIERLSPRVIRVLGDNPSKETNAGDFQRKTSESSPGTNTYLIGRGHARVLLDTGEGKPAWIQNIKSTLSAEGASIQTCLLTHWHPDHVGGVTDLQTTSAAPLKIYKHKPALNGHESWHDVINAQRFEVEPGTTLRAVHCPGHTQDHVAFVLEEENAMFTGDNVLGQGTAVFEELSVYMSSLEQMGQQFTGRAYPGHGPVIEDGNATIAQYLKHRKQREHEIVGVLSGSGKRLSGMTSMDIVKIVYKDYPENLHVPAQGGVNQALRKLETDGKVIHETTTDRWKLTDDASL